MSQMMTRNSTSGLGRTSAFLAATLVLAASLPIASVAATPIAVWDGSNTNLGNFRLTAQNGNTIQDNVITIASDATGGVVYTGDLASLNNSTFIIRCSGLDFSNAGNQYLLALHQNILGGGNGDASYNKVGVSLAANNAAVRGIWENAFYGNDNAQVADPFSSGTDIVVNIQTSGGVFVYEIVTDANTGVRSLVKRFGNTNLKASNTNYKGFSLGGTYEKSSSTLVPAAGWTISKMAVFGSTLSENEMLNFAFDSETATINVTSDTTVSDLNALIAAASARKVVLSVTSGVTISVNAAFTSAAAVSVVSTGNVTLYADSQPAASYFSGVDFSGVQGGLLRSWLTPGVVGVNFVKNYGKVTSGELVASDSWLDTTGASGTSTELFADGLTKITWSASNVYGYKDYSGVEEDSILFGYLDDGNNKGHGAEVTIENVPYATYDVVVYASTDTSNAHFQPKTVNNTTYTVDATGAVSEGNAVWGSSRLETPFYGQNAMRVKNLSGPLTIYGGLNTYSSNGARGGIAAIQIMPTTAEDNITEYTLALSGTATAWTQGAWSNGTVSVDAPLSGYARITLSASTTLTIDDTVALARLVVDGADDTVLTLVTGTGTFVASGSVIVEGGVLKQGSASVLGATPAVVVEDGATFDFNGLGINAATSFTIAGDGAGSWPWALTSSNGAGGAILGGLYLSANATIGGANELKIGQTGAGYYCQLQGFTLTKTGAGALTCTNMNTPGAGTIDLKGGAMTVNQWNNLNSASGTTAVILESGASLQNNTNRAISMQLLQLDGGTLLSDTNPFKVNSVFVGSGSTAKLNFASGASASLTGDLTVTSAMVLDGAMTFSKSSSAANDVVVDVADKLTSSGAITVGAGVTLVLGTSRPTGELTVDDNATLSVKLQTAVDVISLSASAQPANLVVYDADGVLIDEPRVTYSDGTLMIMAQVPTLSASGTTSFDDANSWDSHIRPVSNGDAIIELSDDAQITVSGTYTLGNLTITGAGEVSFSGEGSVTAASISLKNGATLTCSSKISATTAVAIDSGTLLKIDGITLAAAISGAGAVETYGTVVLAHANTMTGGITVKPGSLLSASANGAYGEYSPNWAYTSQRQVVVEDGGTVDINNIANADAAVALTIAGKGVLVDGAYAGAVKYSGSSAITSGSRQISSLVLTGDALVDVGVGWGLVHSGWSNARLGLNGHTLTVRGTGTFPVVNVNNGAATTGTIVLDGASLELSNAASNLAGVDVIAKGCSTINISSAPSSLKSLTVKPSASGTTASNWSLPSGLVPKVDTSNISTAGLTDGQVLTIFTAPSALSASTISANGGGRFTAAIDGATVKATYGVGMPACFLHYDFNNGAAVNTGAAADSGTTISSFGEASSVTLVHAKNGNAVQVHTDYTPYWDTYASGVSPFSAGGVTVTAVAKLRQTGIILWGLGNTNNSNPALGLVVIDANTIGIVTRSTSGTVETALTLVSTEDLTKGWHFYAVVAGPDGMTLYVDNQFASTDKIAPTGIGQQGQLGSFHGGAIGASKVGSDGYLLDDWRVYDTALTKGEVRLIRAQLKPSPICIRLR